MPSKRSAPASEDDSKSKSLKTVSKGTWYVSPEKVTSLMVYHHDKDTSLFSEKVAGFDMDHTVLKPKSGAKFPKNRQDWMYMYEDDVVKNALIKAYAEEGYRIVIFTNQAGIEKKKQKASDIKGKIEDLEKSLGIPITAFCSCANDHFRKPTTAMWDLLESEYNGGLAVDRTKSFYCGDAAGRPAGWESGAKKDFSSGDRSFALNVGVKFLLPEEFFLGRDCSAVPFGIDGVDPAELVAASQANEASFPKASDSQEVVLFVGVPASGKSTLFKKIFAPAGYFHVNRDLMGTKEKCLKAAGQALAEGKSVVIDNTNPSADDRKPFIALCKKQGVPIRCFWMETTRDVAQHNNFVRVKETKGAVRRIPAVAYNMYNKRFQKPTPQEGFSSVCSVPFAPQFATDEEKALYLQRVEKL